MRKTVLTLLTLILISSSILAQSGFNVVSVSVEGNQLSRESLILSVANITPGTDLTSTTTQEAVKRLYRLGFFKDVQILAEEVTGGLALLIKVDELPKLKTLKITGNKKIKTNIIEDEINLSESNFLSGNLIYEKKNLILSKYADKGFFFTDVEYNMDYNEDSTLADLTFKISEGPKLKVENVYLTGAVRNPTEKIISKMRNRKRGFLKSSSFDKDKYSEDKEKIIDFLHKEGYIDAYLKSDSQVVDTANNRMDIYIDIYEGPRYYFGKTEFVGNEEFDSEILTKVLKYKEGKVFDSEKFEESYYELHFIYQEKGFLHVRIVDDRKTEDSLINISFDIVEGLPSEVNLVKIMGNTRTKEKVIRREMKMRPGQVFHRSLLMRSIRDVMALNFFNNVEPNIQDLPSGDVNLLVEVEEKPTAQVSAGAGYSGVDKFVGTFSLGIPNFRGMGQNLTSSVDIGSQRNSYSISFTDPWAFNTPTLMGGDIYYTNREWYTDYYTEGRRGGSVKVGRRLRWPDNYFRVYASYRLEQDRFYNFSDSYVNSYSYLIINHINVVGADEVYGKDTTATTYTASDPLPGSLLNYNEKWLTSSTLQLSVTRDSRNLPEFATEGSVFSYNFETTGGILGGFWKYQKHLASYTQFIPIIGKVALAAKITLGAVLAPANDSTILSYDRFSPGGTGYTGIVRGYDDGSLTPDTLITRIDSVRYYTALPERDTTTDEEWTDETYVGDGIPSSTTYFARIRGNYMMVTNIELQVPFIENQLYGLLFFDAGNSWLRMRDIRFNDVYKGVGIGFRLVVPMVGTIGFDFGYALDDRILDEEHNSRNQSKGWKTHFQIGTTFR